jgi:hypothetical protein
VSGERTPAVINVEDSRKRVVVIDVVVSGGERCRCCVIVETFSKVVVIDVVISFGKESSQ